MLDDLLPLLRTIQPAKLNATLNALATALEGRGERLGENLELVDGYFTQLNPELPDASRRTSPGWPTSPQIYADAAPDLVRMLRNFSVTTRHDRRAKADAYAGFLAGTAGFATTTRQLLRGEREPDHPAGGGRPADPRRPREVLARVPVPAPGPGAVQRLHRRHVRQRRAAHHPRGDQGPPRVPAGRGAAPGARTAARTATALPNPPRPWPGNRFRRRHQGRRQRAQRCPASWSTRRAGCPAAPRSSRSSTRCWPRRWASSAEQVPDLATLLFGPMARGTAVGQS